MSPRPIPVKLVPRCLAFVAIFVSTIMGSFHSSFAADSTLGPKIGRVELGVRDYFKVGFWTSVRVGVENAPEVSTLRVELTVADSDGVPTTASAPLKTAGVGGGRSSALVYTKVGRVGSPIQVSLRDGERRLDQQTLRP